MHEKMELLVESAQNFAKICRDTKMYWPRSGEQFKEGMLYKGILYNI